MAEIKVLTVAPKKKELPFPPFVHLYLSSHSIDDDGRNLMSPELMTDKEVDETVDYLIVQLEKARKKAKSELKKANTKH
ncbi:MAG: hypothetical protein AVO38_15605 [delta proteobacterium ML8_D]|jgi:hypothetical protein|nr:MAG: hypothetical protein AVO38_15605 [delta proteobacterium ML8_D]